MEKIIILGAAESGVGSAILAKKKKFDVFLSDKGAIDPKYKAELLKWKIDFEEGGHTLDRLTDASLCVKSPGIPESAEVVVAIRNKGIRVISEIEFAGKYCSSKTICITGSNGKTTTTTLIYDILKAAGYNVGLGGNIGLSFAYQVATELHDWYVLELSSFQLDGMTNFKADIAVLTNITPDHLDRYNHDFNLYCASKFRIVQNMCKGDTFIYCKDDPRTIKHVIGNKESFSMSTLPFTAKDTLLEGAYLNQDNNIEINIDGHELLIEKNKLQIFGTHNLYNIMASAMAALRAGVDPKTILHTIYNFKGVEHRTEIVCEKDGVLFINDSKATNVDSVYYALQGIERPIIWIAGGQDKGNDYSELIPQVKGKVTTLICMGLDNKKLIDSFTNIIPFIYS
ncbi:MAG: UDP-N-acetylmuramoyl-L-alanine--D-glutamate ligase, partial [Rikenellaceae bacterium]